MALLKHWEYYKCYSFSDDPCKSNDEGYTWPGAPCCPVALPNERTGPMVLISCCHPILCCRLIQIHCTLEFRKSFQFALEHSHAYLLSSMLGAQVPITLPHIFIFLTIALGVGGGVMESRVLEHGDTGPGGPWFETRLCQELVMQDLVKDISS